MREIYATPECYGSLEQVLRQSFPYLSKAHLRRILDQRDVRINGVRCGKGDVAIGDSVEVYASEMWLLGLRFRIIYEDDMLLIVEKPPGISSVADERKDDIGRNPEHRGDHLEAQLQRYYAQARLCHRLDHDTGGLLIAAKCDEAEVEILAMQRAGEIKKYYRCVVWGEPKVGVYEAWLRKNADLGRVQVSEGELRGGKRIRTGIERVERLDGVTDRSVVTVRLYTGRTHQIRAHMAYMGFALVGDDKYGDWENNKRVNVKKVQLWATRLEMGKMGRWAGRIWESAAPF